MTNINIQDTISEAVKQDLNNLMNERGFTVLTNAIKDKLDWLTVDIYRIVNTLEGVGTDEKLLILVDPSTLNLTDYNDINYAITEGNEKLTLKRVISSDELLDRPIIGIDNKFKYIPEE